MMQLRIVVAERFVLRNHSSLECIVWIQWNSTIRGFGCQNESSQYCVFLEIERFQGENVSEDVDETPQKDPRPKLQKKATFQELDAPQEDASLPKNYHVDWSQPSYAATPGPQRLGDQGTV